MKKLFLILFSIFLFSTAFAGYVQTYKVIYDTTSETATFIYVDEIRVGVSTQTIYVYILGTGTVRGIEGIFTQLIANRLTSGDAGSAGDVWTQFASSDSWGEPAAGAGGAGKAVIWLLPGSAKLPNSNYAGLEKKTRTNGVDNLLKFDATSGGTDEHAYYQGAMPAFYGGGNITITIYSVIETTEAAASVAEVNVGNRTKEHDEGWDAAYTAIGTVDVNPTGTSEDLLVDTIAWTANLPTAGDGLSFDIWVDCSDSTFVSFDAELPIVAIKIEED